jgi:hypothetical protein
VQRFFLVTPPSVHQMVLSLEKAGLIARQPGIARSIALAVDPTDLTEQISRYDQPVKAPAELLVVGCTMRSLRLIVAAHGDPRATIHATDDSR